MQAKRPNIRGQAKWFRPVRVNLVQGEPLPPLAKIILDYHTDQQKDQKLASMSFSVDGLPISLNHQFEDGYQFTTASDPQAFKDSSGRYRKRNRRLRPEVLSYRTFVMHAMGPKRMEWKPTGVTAALLLFCSPYWVTARRQVREMDADNKVKPMLDAIEKATDVPDELHWQFYAFKVLSKRERAIIHLFDLGDIVDYYY